MSAPQLAIRLMAEPVRSLAFGSITGTYTGIGTGADHPARLFFLQNWCNQELMFSFDGVNDHFPLQADSHLLLDITSNQTYADGYFIRKGGRIYVKQLGVPTTGTVYLTYFYGGEV